MVSAACVSPLRGVAGAPLYPRAGASSAVPGLPAQAVLDRPEFDQPGMAARGGWRAAGAAPQWLIVDLGRRERLDAVRLSMPAVAAWRLTVAASDSGAPALPASWTMLAQVAAGRPARDYVLRLDGTFRFVRVTIEAGGIPGLAGLRIDSHAVPADLGSVMRVTTPPDGPLTDRPDPQAVIESCDLWSSPAMWASVHKRAPGYVPAIGTYDDADPAVIDARILLARAAGLSRFQSCWYRERGNAGQEVMTQYDGAIRAFAETGRARAAIRWSLLWDNGNPAADGVSGVADFVDHVGRFWIDAYFSRPNYLKLHGRPLLAVADVGRLVAQLGGQEAARRAIAAWRAQARAAGVGDPLLLACNNAAPDGDNRLAAAVGFDAVMAYASPTFTGLLPGPHPSDSEVLAAEAQAWQARLSSSRLPPIVTASIGFDARPWSGVDLFYHLHPTAWAALLRQSFMRAASLPVDQPGHDILYIDNWNEYGEGHFIEPSLAYGTTDLDVLAALLRQRAAGGDAIRPRGGRSAR